MRYGFSANDVPDGARAGMEVVVALTAVALARGAAAGEVDGVWERMKTKEPTRIPSALVDQVDAALADLRRERSASPNDQR